MSIERVCCLAAQWWCGSRRWTAASEAGRSVACMAARHPPSSAARRSWLPCRRSSANSGMPVLLRAGDTTINQSINHGSRPRPPTRSTAPSPYERPATPPPSTCTPRRRLPLPCPLREAQFNYPCSSLVEQVLVGAGHGLAHLVAPTRRREVRGHRACERQRSSAVQRSLACHQFWPLLSPACTARACPSRPQHSRCPCAW